MFEGGDKIIHLDTGREGIFAWFNEMQRDYCYVIWDDHPESAAGTAIVKIAVVNN